MNGPAPLVSVVIPTHDRLPYLRQCLAALAVQTLDQVAFEVIVVADGCRDGTEDALAHRPSGPHVRVVSQPASGASAARNRGAAEARGALLVFIDDDVIASPGLLEAHVRAHDGLANRVVVGPYRVASPPAGDFYAALLFRFWDRTFAEMADARCPQDSRYVLSGNLSVAASTFRDVGGFDETFPGCGVEDHEFGLRMIAARVPLVFAPDAHGRHLDTTDLARSFRRARQEGAAHVQLARLHPEVRPSLLLSRVGPVSRTLVVDVPWLGQALATVARRALDVAQRLRLRHLYGFIYGGLRYYWYCRGVADAAGNHARPSPAAAASTSR
jgi:GT2 family glycosyltransferase